MYILLNQYELNSFCSLYNSFLGKLVNRAEAVHSHIRQCLVLENTVYEVEDKKKESRAGLSAIHHLSECAK